MAPCSAIAEIAEIDHKLRQLRESLFALNHTGQGSSNRAFEVRELILKFMVRKHRLESHLKRQNDGGEQRE